MSRGGECIALLGPSGCGKTTTLRMVAGYVAPDSGRIVVDGRAIQDAPPHRRNIGMVFQNHAPFPHMTAAGNVAFGLEMLGVARAERDARVTEALAMVGLSAFAGCYPAQLSGGQQQRVALVRAIVIRPALLLRDEPLSNIDAGLRVEMRQEIAALRRRAGITTPFVTHDQEEALALADRIAVMHQGRIAAPKPFAAIQGSQDQLSTMFDQQVGAPSVEFGCFTRAHAESRNPNIVIADPVGGQSIATNVARITVGTTKQALAEARVNLHLSPECQRAYAERIYDSPTIRNLALPPDLTAKLVMGEDAIGRLVDFDRDVVIRNQPRWSSRFTREIAG